MYSILSQASLPRIRWGLIGPMRLFICSASVPTYSSTGSSPRTRHRGAGSRKFLPGPLCVCDTQERRDYCRVRASELHRHPFGWVGNSGSTGRASSAVLSPSSEISAGLPKHQSGQQKEIRKCYFSGSQELVKGDFLVSLDLLANLKKAAPHRILFYS